MAFDGIVTKAISCELTNLIGTKITKVFEPDKNNIILGLYGNQENHTLHICIEAHNCRLNLTRHSVPNPLVAPNFCMLLRKHIIGSKITNINTNDLERLVIIDLENINELHDTVKKQLIIELMGKHSNIILTNNNNIIIDSLRHTTCLENSYRDILPAHEYTFPTSNKESFMSINNFNDFYKIISPELTNNCLPKTISNKFNGISTSFINYIIEKFNINSNNKNDLETLYNYIKNIISNTNSNKLSFDLCYSKDYNLILTDSIQDTYHLNYFIDEFYYNKETFEKFISYRNSLLKIIFDTLKKYNNRLLSINSKLNECKKMDTYKLYGELITTNLYKIKNENSDFIELENYYDNNNIIKIPLDKKYSPSINAKRYFKKYQKQKNALEIVNKQKVETLEELNYIESVIYELESCSSTLELQDIFEEISESDIFKEKLKIKSNYKTKKTKKNKDSKNFNPIKVEINGFNAYVGRNNIENDYLTTNFANKTDLWFHTKDIHGSHVILKCNYNEDVPDDVLTQCALLAARHSKAKNSSNVPVDYCKIQYVKKPHGSKPGYVIYTNNRTLYVTP